VGRGVTFDDLEDGYDIGEKVHRVFFHKLIKVGETQMFEKWVRYPTITEEIADCMADFAETGCDGCIGSLQMLRILFITTYQRGCTTNNWDSRQVKLTRHSILR
jgi:hypothetical protein